MSLVKSLSVGNGDMYYINHGSDNFTIIDCCLNEENREAIVEEILALQRHKGIHRMIVTHPDEDHIRGLKYLDERTSIANFYTVANKATKTDVTESFVHYCELRDSGNAYHVYKGCRRAWMNETDDQRGSAGISILWPNPSNEHFIAALAEAEAGTAFNNISLVARYSINDGASFMWIGDLETEFMKDIVEDINLQKTTVVFAPHHGRNSGRIPHSWLEKLDPQIIVIGEAPSRHLNYYTGYQIITQNRAWDITFDCDGKKVHIYSSNPSYERNDPLPDEGQSKYDYYVGTLTAETEYTL